MAPMAAAAPAATRVTRWRRDAGRKFVRNDPRLAPLITTGASGPADPPEAMVATEASRLAKMCRRERSPRPRVTE